MQRTLLAIILLFFASRALAQNARVPTEEDYYAKFHVPINALYGYIQAGPAFARGIFKEEPDPNEPLLDPFIGEDGMGGRTGFFMETGLRSAFSSMFSLKNKPYLTFSLGAELAHSPVNWSKIDGDDYDFEATSWFYAGINGGLGMAFNVQDKFVIEHNYKLIMPLAVTFPELHGGGHAFLDESNNFSLTESDELYVDSKPFISFGHSLGFAVKTRRLRLSIDLFNYDGEQRYKYLYYYDSNEKGAKDYFTAQMSWSTTRLGLGLTF